MEIKPEVFNAFCEAYRTRPNRQPTSIITKPDIDHMLESVAPLIAADALAASPWRKVPETVTPGVEPFDGREYLVSRGHGLGRPYIAFYSDVGGWLPDRPVGPPRLYAPIPPAPEPDE